MPHCRRLINSLIVNKIRNCRTQYKIQIYIIVFFFVFLCSRIFFLYRPKTSHAYQSRRATRETRFRNCEATKKHARGATHTRTILDCVYNEEKRAASSTKTVRGSVHCGVMLAESLATVFRGANEGNTPSHSHPRLAPMRNNKKKSPFVLLVVGLRKCKLIEATFIN